MSEANRDQAAGLRRMLGQGALRVLPVAGGASGAGKTTVLMGIARAAVAAGQRVLVLDAGNLAASLGLRGRWELAELLEGTHEYRDVVLGGPAGIGIVPAARGVAALRAAGRGGGELFAGFARLSQRPDLLLIEVPARDPGLCALLPCDAELLVVSGSSSDAITATYACLKDLARRHGRRRFRLFVNRAPQTEASALHRHVSTVVRRFLGTPLAYGGSLPDDGADRTAASGAPVPGAGAFDALVRSLGDWRLAEYGPELRAAPR